MTKIYWGLSARLMATLESARRFVRREDGAVMVEWVALAASLVVSAITISYIVMHGLHAPACNVGKQLSTSAVTC
jgi:Flp pilus assembly pilin Flp